jgi:hypothetical protein
MRFGAKSALESAIALFQKAIEIDPGYALARAAVGERLRQNGIAVDLANPAWIDRAEEQLRRAQELDPLLAEVHIVRNWIRSSGYRQFKMEEAVHEPEAAKQLNPSVGHSTRRSTRTSRTGRTVGPGTRRVDRDRSHRCAPSVVPEPGATVFLSGMVKQLRGIQRFGIGPARGCTHRHETRRGRVLNVSDLAKSPDGPSQIGARALSLALRGRFAEAQALVPRTATLRNIPVITTRPTTSLVSMHSKRTRPSLSSGFAKQSRPVFLAIYCSRVTRISTPYGKTLPSLNRQPGCGLVGNARSSTSSSARRAMRRAGAAVRMNTTNPRDPAA